MKLYYYRDPVGNFGDDLNPWLWPRVFPGMFDDDERTLFVGIGTILNEEVPREALKVVFGSGAGLGQKPSLDETWKVYFVRGPLSAAALGLSEETAVTDPAILVQLFAEPVEKSHDFGFMPHLESQIRAELRGLDLKRLTESVGIRYINPCGGVDETLAALQTCRVVLAEAMHAAIVADALRIPWVPVRFYDHILGFKWKDWCASLGLEYRPHDFVVPGHPASESGIADGLKRIIRGKEFMLSHETTNATALAGVQRQVRRLRIDWEDGRFPGGQPGGVTTVVAATGPHPRPPVETWWHRLHMATEEAESVLPEGERFIFIDEEQIGCEFAPGRTRVPFVYQGDAYVGHPADSQEAIDRLSHLQATNVNYLVIAWPAFWWLDEYAEFGRHLREHHGCLLENDLLFIYDLASSP